MELEKQLANKLFELYVSTYVDADPKGDRLPDLDIFEEEYNSGMIEGIWFAILALGESMHLLVAIELGKLYEQIQKPTEGEIQIDTGGDSSDRAEELWN